MRRARVAVLVLAVAVTGGWVGERYRAERMAAAPVEAPLVVEELARALEELFLDPEIGMLYAAALRDHRAAGRYGGLRSASALASRVTKDLQAIHGDGHLRLLPPRGGAGGRSSSVPERSGVDRTGWIADGIAYVGFSEFPGNDATLRDLRSFLADHAAAGTVILDLRVHGGGMLDEMDLLFSHLYGERTVLVHMDTRAAAFRERARNPYLEQVDGPAGIVRQAHLAIPVEPLSPLSRAEVVVLTSGYTGSAAEHLALALRRTHRATLIGETTAGAGHYGRVLDLAGGFTAVVPVGRTFDPDSGEGWEGTGVEPHLAVPAADALRAALVRSGIPPREADRRSRAFRPAGSMKRILPLRPR